MIEQIVIVFLVLAFLVFFIQAYSSEYASLWMLLFLAIVSLLYGISRVTKNYYIFLVVILLLLIKPLAMMKRK